MTEFNCLKAGAYHMKRVLVLLLALSLCLTLSACGDSASQPAATSTPAQTSDMAYVKEKGTLIVGITEFEPMDYQDQNGNWIGFDAEMAAAFAQSLGVSAQFEVIEWDNKVSLLNDKAIDVVWNGMTLSSDIRSSMETSNSYFNNAQVVIVKANAASRYQTTESLADATFVVESSSAGQEQAETHGFSYTEVPNQAVALQRVSAGEYDAAIIDFLMAKTLVGEATRYSDLAYTVSLSSEEYGVGFRKGSDLAAALNDFFVAKYTDGSMQSIARKYGIAAFLLAQ